jgi:hypothetical protein
MKLILSTIIGGIVLFVLGWLFYGVIFMNFMNEGYGSIMRGPDDFKLWAIIVANLLEAFFLAWIYPKGYKGGSPAKEGFMFGIDFGALIGFPYIFYMWASFPITWQTALVDGILAFVMTLITGLVIGLIYGRIGEKKEAAAQ